jgi:hypothetical protein
MVLVVKATVVEVAMAPATKEPAEEVERASERPLHTANRRYPPRSDWHRAARLHAT